MATSVRQKIGQCFFIGIQGTSLSSAEKKFIVDNNIGGIILFARNCKSPNQVRELCAEIQALSSSMADKAPLLIGVDQEGGRVARLKSPFTVWPPMKRIGELDSATLAFKFAESLGHELKAVGINVDFAPCVDVLTNPQNTAIGDRALGSDPELVAKLGSALVRGFIKAEIIPCAKHFPGHGNTILDSHEALPIENASLEELSAREFVAFKKVFRARLEMVMVAHIKFPQIDPEWPATLSKIFLDDILRGELGYRGLVITDDLDMKALRNNYSIEDIATRAATSGANILLYCNEPESPPRGLDAIEKALTDKKMKLISIESSYTRVLKLKQEFVQNVEVLPEAVMNTLVGHPQHLALAKAIETGELPADLKT